MSNDTDTLQAFTDATLAPWRFATQMAQAWPALVPQNLAQSINPGWTNALVQVNNTNSSAPDTEQEILRHHSYGRQMGRLMDVTALLLERADAKTRADARAKDFTALRSQIDEIKQEQRAARVERLRDELIQLRREQPEVWRELRALLD